VVPFSIQFTFKFPGNRREKRYIFITMYPNTFTWFPQKTISDTCGAISICLHTYPKKAFVFSKFPAETAIIFTLIAP